MQRLLLTWICALLTPLVQNALADPPRSEAQGPVVAGGALSEPESTQAEEILQKCREEVYRYVRAQLREPAGDFCCNDYGVIVARDVPCLMDYYLTPYADLLARHALAKLPRARAIDRSQWTSVERKQDTKAVRYWMDQVWAAQPKACRWNPVMVVKNSAAVFAMSVSSEPQGGYRIPAVLVSFLPPQYFAVDANLAQPVIGVAEGPELWLCSLRRAADGSYLPEKIEWLKKKNCSVESCDALASEASSSQRAVHACREAIWTDLSAKANILKADEVSKEIARLARKNLSAHRQEIAAEAKRLLAEYPKLAPLDRARWKPIVPEAEMKKFLESFYRTYWRAETDRFLVAPWDLVEAARFCNAVMLNNVMLSARLSLREDPHGGPGMLEPLLGSEVSVADADSSHPTIAFHAGDQITLYKLEQREDGIFRVAAFEWLKRSDASSVPNDAFLRGFLPKAASAMKAVQGRVKDDPALKPLAEAKPERNDANVPKSIGLSIHGRLRIDAILSSEMTPGTPLVPPKGCWYGNTRLRIPGKPGMVLIETVTGDSTAQRRLVHMMVGELANWGVNAHVEDDKNIDSHGQPIDQPPAVAPPLAREQEALGLGVDPWQPRARQPVCKVVIYDVDASAEEVERDICVPAEAYLAGVADVAAITSLSFYERAEVYVVGKPDVKVAALLGKVDASVAAAMVDLRFQTSAGVNRAESVTVRPLPAPQDVRMVDRVTIGVDPNKEADGDFVDWPSVEEAAKKAKAAGKKVEELVVETVNGKKKLLRDIATVKTTREPSHRIRHWPPIEETKSR